MERTLSSDVFPQQWSHFEGIRWFRRECVCTWIFQISYLYHVQWCVCTWIFQISYMYHVHWSHPKCPAHPKSPVFRILLHFHIDWFQLHILVFFTGQKCVFVFSPILRSFIILFMDFRICTPKALHAHPKCHANFTLHFLSPRFRSRTAIWGISRGTLGVHKNY